MKQKKICFNCFKELKESEVKCENCGYDASEDRERFPMALTPGTILAGKYIVGRVLGQGGFGITYVAQDYQTKQLVAMKEFFPDTMASRTTGNKVQAHTGATGENFVYGKDCFLEEAKTLAEFIGNENIVRVISYFEENGTAYFAMEYIEGGSFQDYIKSHGGKVSWEEAKKFLLPVMDALAAVHSKGIVHRDVTPDNIYITEEGVVKLLDFGAARYSLGDKSRSLDVVLKHGFAPKEQYTRHGKQGPFTDVYTVGASFYFALTGKKTPDAIDRMEEDDLVPPSSLGVSIPADAEDAILKALNVQPQDRFQSMTDFKNALLGNTGASQTAERVEAVVSGAGTGAEQTQPAAAATTPAPAPKDKKIWVMIAGISGIIILLIIIIVLLATGNKTEVDTGAEQTASSVIEEEAGNQQEPEPQSSPQNEIEEKETAEVTEEEMTEEAQEEAADDAEEVTEEEDAQVSDEESYEQVTDLTDKLELTEETENYDAAVEDADYTRRTYDLGDEYPDFEIHYSDFIYNEAWLYEGESYTPVYGENEYTVVFTGDESSLTATIARDPENRNSKKLLKKIKSVANRQGNEYELYGVLYGRNEKEDAKGMFVDTYADGIYLVHRTFRVYDGYYMMQETRTPQYLNFEDELYKSYYSDCIYFLCGFNANKKAPVSFDEAIEQMSPRKNYPYPQ